MNYFDCNALCDLGASSSIMPKNDVLELKPLDDSILGFHLIDSTVKRYLGRIDNVLIFFLIDRKSTRLNSSHSGESRMPSSA